MKLRVAVALACAGLAFSAGALAVIKVPVKNLPGIGSTQGIIDGPDGISDPGWFPGDGAAGDWPGGDGGGGVYERGNKAPSTKGNKSGDCHSGVLQGRPIATDSGTKLETYPIFSLPGEMGLSFTLYYNSALKLPQTLSNPYWSTNLQYTLNPGPCHVDKQGDLICGGMIYLRPDGSEIHFTGAPEGSSYTQDGDGGLATLSYNGGTGTYTLHDEDATTKVFGSDGELLSITNPAGIKWTISASGSSNGTTYTVTHSSGKSFSITYGVTANGITPVTVHDPAGNVYSLQMTGAILSPNFQSITYPGTPETTVSFKYSSVIPDYLTEVDYNGAPYDYTSYDTTSTDPYYGWATANYLADNSESVAISYGQDAAGNLQATVTNALGHRQVQIYDGTDGAGGAYNGQLSQTNHDAVSTCGATTQSRSYDANGNLSRTVDNNGNVHTYTYAATGQLQTETEAYGTSLARTTDYTWDPDLQLNRLTSVTVEGWSKTVYAYNAQNRLASVKVTNLSSTGVTNQTLTTSYNYTLYANGMVHTKAVTHPSPGDSDTDTYTYDTLGNLTSLANGLGQTTTYSNYNGLGEPGRVVGPNGDITDYTYDARGRVQSETTYPNGTAATWTYGYDGFGLPASEASPLGEATTWNRDAEMRVTTIVRNDKDGTSTENFHYDANGDVDHHWVSRGGATSFEEIFRYDALGRLYQRQGMHGQLLTYGYDGNGNVLTTEDAVGHTVVNHYDALDRLDRVTSSGGASPPMPSTAPTLTVPTTSSNGSYSLNWSAVSAATRYMLQEQVNGGDWTPLQSNGSTTFSLSSQSPGTYSYRVMGCNVSGCGPWSSTAVVYVTQIAGHIDAAPIDGSGNASVLGWACSTGLAQSINVDLYVGGPAGSGTGIGRYTANQASEPAVASACGVGSGSYRFSIPLTNDVRAQYAGQPIYIHGISPVGAGNLLIAGSGSFYIPVSEPPGAPTLSVPGSSTTGSYTASWTAITGATSYALQEQVGGGAWQVVQNSSATSWTASGKSDGTYSYEVQACIGTDCNAWSNPASVTVLLPPPSPASISAPATSSGSVAVSWPASSTATSYTLQHRLGTGGWSTVYSGGGTAATVTESATGSYTYQVEACNASGCSGAWTTSHAVAVTIPPASAPGPTAPSSNTTGSYTVSWSGVSGATSYTLQEQTNGGGWSTLQSSSATSKAISGKANGTYGYHVQACNAGGCGPWSSVATVQVLLIPPVPTGISATIYKIADSANGESMQAASMTTASTTQSAEATLSPQARPIIYEYDLSASWSASNGASSYDVQYCSSSSCSAVNITGTSAYITVNAATSTMNVRACNASGCSAWSASITPPKVSE